MDLIQLIIREVHKGHGYSPYLADIPFKDFERVKRSIWLPQGLLDEIGLYARFSGLSEQKFMEAVLHAVAEYLRYNSVGARDE